MTVTIYGIKNCDTMKKARTWLDAKGVAYRFHDYKAEGIDAASLTRFVDALGWRPCEPRRHHLPRPAGCRQAGSRCRKGDRADARPALDDQAPDPRP
ncbi:hypothetical protein GCM10023069_18790 [Shinella granuli]